MFAKENEREGEKRGGRNEPRTRHLRIKIPVHPRRLLSRSIGMPCYSQVPSLLMRALFSLIVNQSRPQSSSAHDGQKCARSQKRKHWFRE